MFAQLIGLWSEDFAWVWISSAPRQAALILGVALLVRCCPKMAAAWRHWIWLVAALAIGLIPLAAVLLPQWPVIPAEWVYGPGITQATQDEVATLLGTGMVSFSPGESPTLGWVEVCFLIWMLGVLLLMARLVAGMLGLRSFQRGRLPVYKGRLCARLEYCRRLAGVKTLVDLYLSTRSPLPMTWGVLRPAINLPREAEHWSNERLDAVFLHELGHIERADCWTNMVLKIVCALNWFNPFVWMAARRTYLAQEVACDDFACAKLRPSDYARHLVELTAVVKDFHRREIEPAVGLSSCDHLRLRVAAALDPKRSRRSLPSRMASLMSSLVFLFMAAVAMISLRFVDDTRAALVEGVAVRSPIGEGAVELSPGEEFGFPLGETWGGPVSGLDSDLAALGLGQSEWPWASVDAVMEWVGPERDAGPEWFGPKNKQVVETLRPDAANVERSSLGSGAVANQNDEELLVPENGKELPPAPEPPLVIPAKVITTKAIVVPPKVNLQPNKGRASKINESTLDWRAFQRRPGKRRGKSVVLSYPESVFNRYARLSPPDRAREGHLRDYLARHGVRISERRLRLLLEHMRDRS